MTNDIILHYRIFEKISESGTHPTGHQISSLELKKINMFCLIFPLGLDSFIQS